MKKLLFTVALLVPASATFSQDNKALDSSAYFIVLYTVGESWDTTKQFHEQAYFNEHSSYLGTLRKTKKIVIGARYSDTGMIVIKAKDETEANRLITEDIAIQHKLFNADIYPFGPFYSGCIE